MTLKVGYFNILVTILRYDRTLTELFADDMELEETVNTFEGKNLKA